MELTGENIRLAYAMCGFNCINPDITADMFNILIKKGMKFNIYDACVIKVKHIDKPNHRPNTNSFRVFYKYKRDK